MEKRNNLTYDRKEKVKKGNNITYPYQQTLVQLHFPFSLPSFLVFLTFCLLFFFSTASFYTFFSFKKSLYIVHIAEKTIGYYMLELQFLETDLSLSFLFKCSIYELNFFKRTLCSGQAKWTQGDNEKTSQDELMCQALHDGTIQPFQRLRLYSGFS